MAEPGPERRPPPADLEATIAALPKKKEALREAFDCLVACSPYPLPFTWEDLDAHISWIQASISRRFRQLQVLEAALLSRADSVATAETQDSKNQEEEEEGDYEEEDGEEEGETTEEEVEEEEVEEEVVEEEEVEGEVVEEAEDATRAEEGLEADEEMQPADEEEENGDDGVVAEEKKLEIDMEAREEEREASCYAVKGAKNAKKAFPKKAMTRKQVRGAPPGGSKELFAACASMDANTLVKFICCYNNAHGKELPTALRHAPDAAALVLQVVKLFLSSKTLKVTRVWSKCIGLMQCVPEVAAKPSAETIEEA